MVREIGADGMPNWASVARTNALLTWNAVSRMSEKWTNTNLPTRTEQYEAKRAALIKQAALAFRSRGFYATSMEDISNAVGVTKGALYRYVENKQEILFECFKASNRVGDSAMDIARRSDGKGLDKLKSFILYFVEKYIEENTAGAAMVDLGALFPEQRAEIIAARDRVDSGLREIVRQGVQDGSIIERDARLTVFTIMGAINWIPSWYSPTGPMAPGEIAEVIADIFCSGLQPQTLKAKSTTKASTSSKPAPTRARTPAR